MKKLVLTLCVAMVTMVSMAFAQSKEGGSGYIVVKNKTTKETTPPITLESFSNLWGGYEGSVPKFPLGIYAGDEIEVSYTSSNTGVGVSPSLFWGYTIGSETYKGGDNASLSWNFTVPKRSSDNLTLQVGFDYYAFMTYPPIDPTHYTLTFENKVVNDVRFFSEYSVLTHELRVKYVHFNDLIPYLQQSPTVYWYSVNGGLILGNESMDRNGTVTFDTKGRTGYFIVKVIVNGVALPAETILLY